MYCCWEPKKHSSNTVLHPDTESPPNTPPPPAVPKRWSYSSRCRKDSNRRNKSPVPPEVATAIVRLGHPPCGPQRRLSTGHSPLGAQRKLPSRERHQRSPQSLI